LGNLSAKTTEKFQRQKQLWPNSPSFQEKTSVMEKMTQRAKQKPSGAEARRAL
jgi:hypothetical protein